MTEKAKNNTKLTKDHAEANFTEKAAENNKPNRGTRNLILLGVIAVAIALGATTLSIWIYYETGDIYIDRSRPGFLPEEEEVAEEENQSNDDYAFDETDDTNSETLNEYLDNLQTEVDKLDAIEDTFDSAPLTDESLGIVDNEVSADE